MYSQPGPFPVGVAELTDGPVPITVFYPGLDGAEVGRPDATYDLRAWLPPAEAAKVGQVAMVDMHAYAGLTPADPDGGPYPLVVFSPGLAGYRLQSTFLTTHLASWGFVVATVEHPYRNLTAAFGDLGSVVAGFGTTDAPDVGQLVAAIDQVASAASLSTGPLAGLTVDTTTVGAVGHSAGGFAAYAAAATDPRILTYVALASPAGGSFSSATPTTTPAITPPDKPSLLIAGSADVIAPLPRVQAAYDALPTPKALAVIDGVTHLGFMDVCMITPPGEANVLQVAKDAGVAVPDIILRLFADGCDPKYTTASVAWGPINALDDGAAARRARSRRSSGRDRSSRARRRVSRSPHHAVEGAVTSRGLIGSVATLYGTFRGWGRCLGWGSSSCSPQPVSQRARASRPAARPLRSKQE